MLSRYIGNKAVLLNDIGRIVNKHAPAGGTVCDIFSGTLAVSLELKRRGYRVISNDINAFSAAYGRAFLMTSHVPQLDLTELMPLATRTKSSKAATVKTQELVTRTGYAFLGDRTAARNYERLVAVADYLQEVGPERVPRRYRRTDFYDCYSEAGRKSKFVSTRGQRGRRRFFTPANAARIDIVLNHIRWWRRERMIREAAYATLLCMLMNAVERVSNTQGTYHDFPRDEFDPRSLKPLRLATPSYDGIVDRPRGVLLGNAEDSLKFIERVPAHDILYIDPPYNFRQYTSYYFLLNVIAKYAEIDDLDGYFGAIEFVRGQNMSDDFDSTFCKPGQFIPSLKDLIAKAKARWVLLSYFSGRNHWNDFKVANNDIGLGRVRELFEDGLFVRGSARIYPVSRLNYQSYGGYNARVIEEYLLLARKRPA